MRFVMFYHSLVSDWNHGNAHFRRGVAAELTARGHEVVVYEPEDGWSRRHLLEAHGTEALEAFAARYPTLRGRTYSRGDISLDRVLAGADVVIVHEWTEPALVAAIGEHRARGGTYRLLFHDTHHRAVSDAGALGAMDLRQYDGVLAFGAVLADLYRQRGWFDRVFVWHEAADTRMFHPRTPVAEPIDLVWIGNWGDDERAAELREFLIEPVKALGLRADVWGVRYPEAALKALEQAGIRYRGWLPNFDAPAAFAGARVTVHVPRRPYAEALPGIPTIRMFEALACGIPLVSAPWRDSEGLFRRGADHLVARDGREMREQLQRLLSDDDARRAVAASGLETIRARHTCGHRVDQLLEIVGDIDPLRPGRSAAPRAGEAAL